MKGSGSSATSALCALAKIDNNLKVWLFGCFKTINGFLCQISFECTYCKVLLNWYFSHILCISDESYVRLSIAICCMQHLLLVERRKWWHCRAVNLLMLFMQILSYYLPKLNFLYFWTSFLWPFQKAINICNNVNCHSVAVIFCQDICLAKVLAYTVLA